MQPSLSRWALVTFCSGVTRATRQRRALTRLCISGFIASSSSACCCSPRARFLAACGELFLGQILGLGPEGNVGPDRAALLYSDVARKARWLVDRVRSGRGERG